MLMQIGGCDGGDGIDMWNAQRALSQYRQMQRFNAYPVEERERDIYMCACMRVY